MSDLYHSLQGTEMFYYRPGYQVQAYSSSRNHIDYIKAETGGSAFNNLESKNV